MDLYILILALQWRDHNCNFQQHFSVFFFTFRPADHVTDSGPSTISKFKILLRNGRRQRTSRRTGRGGIWTTFGITSRWHSIRRGVSGSARTCRKSRSLQNKCGRSWTRCAQITSGSGRIWGEPRCRWRSGKSASFCFCRAFWQNTSRSGWPRTSTMSSAAT